MALMKLDLSTLHEFDNGRLKAAFERAMKTVIADCRDRGALDKTRKVVIEFAVWPSQPDHTGEVDTLAMEYQVKATIPALSRDSLSLGIRKNNELVFNNDSPGNVDQRTFDNDD